MTFRTSPKPPCSSLERRLLATLASLLSPMDESILIREETLVALREFCLVRSFSRKHAQFSNSTKFYTPDGNYDLVGQCFQSLGYLLCLTWPQRFELARFLRSRPYDGPRQYSLPTAQPQVVFGRPQCLVRLALYGSRIPACWSYGVSCLESKNKSLSSSLAHV